MSAGMVKQIAERRGLLGWAGGFSQEDLGVEIEMGADFQLEITFPTRSTQNLDSPLCTKV
jgi:hypothetical protein